MRRHGSIAAAVESGYVSAGAMAACVRTGVPFVLGGSIRDDGPLPDVYVSTADAADAMRALTLECEQSGDDLLVSARLREW